YSRIDGIQGQTLYVCEAGKWNTVNTTLGTAAPAGSVAPVREQTTHETSTATHAPTAAAPPSQVSHGVPASQVQSSTLTPTTTSFNRSSPGLHHPVGQKH